MGKNHDDDSNNNSNNNNWVHCRLSFELWAKLFHIKRLSCNVEHNCAWFWFWFWLWHDIVWNTPIKNSWYDIHTECARAYWSFVTCFWLCNKYASSYFAVTPFFHWHLPISHQLWRSFLPMHFYSIYCISLNTNLNVKHLISLVSIKFPPGGRGAEEFSYFDFESGLEYAIEWTNSIRDVCSFNEINVNTEDFLFVEINRSKMKSHHSKIFYRYIT